MSPPYANFVSVERIEGVLKFEYNGKLREIPYCNELYGAKNRLHLKDKKGCEHIVDLINGKWELLWPEKFPKDFGEVLDWVIKQELGQK